MKGLPLWFMPKIRTVLTSYFALILFQTQLCSLAAVLGISGDSFVGVIDLVVATDVLVTEL